MSTYLVSWAVVPSDFGVKKITNVPNLDIDVGFSLNEFFDFTLLYLDFYSKISVYGRASEVNAGLGDFALEVAEKTLNYMLNSLKIREALPPKIGKTYL